MLLDYVSWDYGAMDDYTPNYLVISTFNCFHHFTEAFPS